MKSKHSYLFLLCAIAFGMFFFGSNASAEHSWGVYHWARTSSPVTLKLGSNLSSVWSPYLTQVSSDWNASSVIKTSVVSGLSNPKNCKAVSGRVEVCNSKYGNNGWLGIASIWTTGGHITQATVKLNDTYYVTPKYNTPAWRRMVMCQEIAHTFGLDHQDEGFDNTNLGTCMDYTNDPDGSIKSQLSNVFPNTHDFEQLESIYSHLDTTTTVAASTASQRSKGDEVTNDPSTWGKAHKGTKEDEKPSHYERDLGNGQKVYTFIIWAQ